MKEILEKRLSELTSALTELYMNKEEIEEKIKIQKTAIGECSFLLRELEKEVQ